MGHGASTSKTTSPQKASPQKDEALTVTTTTSDTPAAAAESSETRSPEAKSAPESKSDDASPPPAASSSSSSSSSPSTAAAETPPSDGKPIVPHEFRALELESSSDANYNCKRLRFKFPDADAQLTRSVGACVMVQAIVDGQTVVRPYTPVSPILSRGYLTLLVKVYDKPNGKMGNHLAAMQPGDKLEFKGPFTKLDYVANSCVRVRAGWLGVLEKDHALLLVYDSPRW
jgi:hypothetical protein